MTSNERIERLRVRMGIIGNKRISRGVYMSKYNEVVIKNKRMANTVRWLTGEHYEERKDLKDNTNIVYVFTNREKVLKAMTELRQLRKNFGVIE